METKEALLTSCRHTQQWSACLWDPTTGNALNFYKNGGVIAPNTLSLLGNDYLLACDEAKPILHLWPLNSQEPTKKHTTILADKVGALAICPRNTYLAVGIGVKLYVWHTNSGKLFSVQKRHFQAVSCVKFSSDGGYVIVGGQDGMLVVYDFITLVSLQSSFASRGDLGQVEPHYTKHDHSMAICDIHVGAYGAKARLATASNDHTCKLYELETGNLLLSLVFDGGLTCVKFDNACWNLFVGGEAGRLQHFYLKEPPRGVEHHVGGGEKVFVGHTQRVACLDVNLTNTNLVSGSDDGLVFIWEIRSRQVLRRIEHKGAVTNVMFVLNHENFFKQVFKPKLVFRNLERELIESDCFVVSCLQEQDLDVSDSDDEVVAQGGGVQSDLQRENDRLRAVNKQLFEAAVAVSGKYNDF